MVSRIEIAVEIPGHHTIRVALDQHCRVDFVVSWVEIPGRDAGEGIPGHHTIQVALDQHCRLNFVVSRIVGCNLLHECAGIIAWG